MAGIRLAICALLLLALFLVFSREAFAPSGTKELPDRIRWKKDGAEMVKVPEGKFWMGSNRGPDAEKPRHQVFLKTFYIDRYEVTNTRYLGFCVDTGHGLPIHLRRGMIQQGRENHPVNNVTFRDADAYCRWAGRRLPTEAEWEKAARGSQARIYPWGNGWNARLSNNRTSPWESTMPVGSFPDGASPYGAMDMAGNVWEWTADWYKSYPGARACFDETGKRRVARGGAYFYSIELLRTANRYPLDPDDATEHGGFRCAVSVNSNEK
jgi:formylglycine-generating enzyme required for sulfatase activity